MRTSVPGQASSSPVDRAADGPEALRQLHLPNEIWQQIARAVRTQCRLRGVHFSPEDDKALKLLKSAAFQAKHGGQLREVRGVRLPCRRERAALAAAELEPADIEVFGDRPHQALSMGAFGSLRAVSLCRVLADYVSHLPAFPAGLLELTLDGGPGRMTLPSQLHRNLRDDDERKFSPDSLDLRHLAALERLTLVRLTSKLCQSLLGMRERGPRGVARLPPQLQTLRVVELGCPAGAPGQVNLNAMLRWCRPALPPARIPVLHVCADEVICGPLQPWPTHAEPAIPETIRVRTRCLSLGAPGSKWYNMVRMEDGDSGTELSWYTAPDAQRVHPLAALAMMLRSLPVGVAEMSLAFAAQQPLRLRLQWHMGCWEHRQHGPRTCGHDVVFATAADLAHSMRQLAGRHGLSMRVVDVGDDECVIFSRVTNAVVEYESSSATCRACMAELCF